MGEELGRLLLRDEQLFTCTVYQETIQQMVSFTMATSVKYLISNRMNMRVRATSIQKQYVNQSFQTVLRIRDPVPF